METNKDLLEHTICYNHSDVIFILESLKRSLGKKSRPVEDIKSSLAEAIAILRVCKKQGQKMENRLQRYKKGIENLGFSRTKRVVH